jgi:hypothetical protein
VHYTKLIPVLVEEIKHLRARLEHLEGVAAAKPA